MKARLYARELLEKLLSEKELKILEVLMDRNTDADQQIEELLKEE
jgi:hypothetical protein